MTMSAHEDPRAEKRPLRWMKLFLWALAIGATVLVISWLRAPAGEASSPLGKEPARQVAPPAK